MNTSGVELKVGDIVRLRSGSPALTISQVLEHNVHVLWFVEGAVAHGVFPKQVLDLSSAYRARPNA